MENVVVNRREKALNIDLNKHAELVFWAVSLISVMFKCFYFQLTTQTINNENYLGMIISSIGMELILAALVFILFNKNRNIALLIVNFLIVILLISDTNFFRYYYNAISVSLVYQINFLAAGKVNSSIMSLFKPSDILYLIDLPIITILYHYIRKNSLFFSVSFVKRLVFGIAVIFISLGGFINTYEKADNKSFANDSNYIIKSMGILYYHFYDVKSFVKEEISDNSSLTDDERLAIDSYYEERRTNTGNTDSSDNNALNYAGTASGKNLIMVQMEAMQGFVINKEINGKEITPNLNKLIKDSLYFNNIYYQVAGGNTSDAEFLSNTSLYPLKEGAVYHRFPQNKYYSMAWLLKDKGYGTYASHAFIPTFWNRAEIYPTLGFDRFINKDDYVMDDFAGWDGESALSDISFFRQTLDKIDTSKPFYSFMVTLSSHHPFDYFEDYDFDVGQYEGTYLGKYLKAANYGDKSIGTLIDELKKRGLYENTLLVLYGDHSAVPKHQSEDLFKFVGTEFNELNWAKLQKVPFIIHCSGIEDNRTIDKIGGQIDILPTVADFLGIKAENAIGKNLLGNEEGYAVLRNGSVVTDDFAYISSLREAYDTVTGEVLNKEEYEDKYQKLVNQLEISDTIIFKDAFSAVKKVN